MTTRRRQHDQGTTELLAELAHLLSVPCPACGAPEDVPCCKPFKHRPRAEHALHVACSAPPYGCGAAAHEPCIVPHGTHRNGGPGCVARVTAADAADPAGAHPALPTPPERPASGRRLLPVEQVRRDVVDHRVLCGWCRHPIVWALNAKKAETPVDAEPSVDGDLVLTVDACGPRCLHAETHPLGSAHPIEHCGPRCIQLTAQQIPAALAHGQRLHTPHRKTCPQGSRPTWSRGVRHNHDR
jgi:hypothetical protein